MVGEIVLSTYGEGALGKTWHSQRLEPATSRLCMH